MKKIAFFVAAAAFIGLAASTTAATMAERLSGYILLQVEDNGEAWYVEPQYDTRYYMGRPSDAFDLMRAFGLGIAHGELMDYIVGRFPARLSGMIVLDVEQNGEAYYVYPDDLHGYYLGRPADAFQVMRDLGLGISNTDLRQITVGDGSGTPPEDIEEPEQPIVRANYNIVDTYQSHCFDNQLAINCPTEGDYYFGQDAQYIGTQPSYTDNGNGTVTDNVTGLVWQQGHNTERLTFQDATLTCDWLTLAGHYDWRLPTIKELYSLTDWRGLTGEIDFIDSDYFALEWMDELDPNDPFAETHWPGMMGQTWSSTIYQGNLWGRPDQAAFFYNFLDGRIKSASTDLNTAGLFYRCVRGPEYGINDFVDNEDGTVTDNATGLTWQQSDDGETRNWMQALAYCENLELAEQTDWRLPNVKELQSIVNYNEPEPAKYHEFEQTDPSAWYWSSTTLEYGGEATYVCFGKCSSYDGVDTHGAGAQRSDPKSGDPADYPEGRGGQEDDVRIYNYTRCVRDGSIRTDDTSEPETAPTSEDQPEGGPEGGDAPANAPLPPDEAVAACDGRALNSTCTTPIKTQGTCAYHETAGMFCRP